MTDTLTARLLAEIERREYEANAARGLLGVETEWFDVDNMRGRGLTRADAAHIADNSPKRVLAYLAALKSIVETIGEWRHAVVDDCWYTCAAATEEREGSESCAVDEPGACDCGLDTRRTQVLAIVAEGLGVEG